MNSGDTSHFIIRNNHIHHTGLLNSSLGTTEGEGMYVGCNNAACIASNHLIENNYIHHLRSTSGGGNDGIEIKPGSFGNIIRNNVIHDTTIGTRYPCIFVYGGGVSKNTVEGNALWNCGEAIQVAADADIHNNLIFNSDVGITTAPHSQSPEVKNVHIINNTLYGHQTCLYMRWNNAQDVTLANNAIYCPDKTAVQAVSMPDLLTGFRANYVVGNLLGTSLDNQIFFDGGNASEFTDPLTFNFWPVPGSFLINSADSSFSPANDFNENPRINPHDVGAYETNNQPDNPGWQVSAGFKAKAPTNADTDNDGIPDSSDNCIEMANNSQIDTDADGHGNRCDADFDNSGFVNYDDFETFLSYFGSDNAHADFDETGFVNYDDFESFLELFGRPPGPSANLNQSIPDAIRNHQPHTWTPISLNTLADVDPCPARDCGYSAIEGQSGVLNDYNGGIFASEEEELGGLVVWGGGHNGYYGNEVYFFDLKSLRWIRKTNPTVGQIIGDAETIDLDSETCLYYDGNPVAQHTYDALTYIPTTHQFFLPQLADVASYKLPGIHGGCNSTHGITFNFISSTWVTLDQPTPTTRKYNITEFDKNRNAVWLWRNTWGRGGLAKYDVASGQWTTYESADISPSAHSTAAIDPVRDLLVVSEFEYAENPSMVVKDLANPDAERIAINTIGDVEIEDQSNAFLGFEWVPSFDKFVAWSSGSSLYYLTPPENDWQTAPWVWEKVVLEGIARPNPINGPSGKFQVAPELGIAFVVTTRSDPVYAARLLDPDQQ